MSWTEDREHEYGEDFGPPTRRHRGCACTGPDEPSGGCPGYDNCPYAGGADQDEEPEPDDEPDYDRDGDHHDQMAQRLKETR